MLFFRKKALNWLVLIPLWGLAACGGGGGGASSPAQSTSRASTSPSSESILSRETTTAVVSPEAAIEYSAPKPTSIQSQPATLATLTPTSTASLTSTEVSRVIHLSDFGIDLAQFPNSSAAFASIFIAAGDWVGEQSSESHQFLVGSLSTLSRLDTLNQITVNVPLAVTHISMTVFDGQKTLTARVPL